MMTKVAKNTAVVVKDEFEGRLRFGWERAEVACTKWFRASGYKAELMPINNKGYDILVNNEIRIDVKFASPKKRDENEFLFSLKKGKKNAKGHGKVCDYFLMVFWDVDPSDGKRKYRAYLFSYDWFTVNQNTFTMCKKRLDNFQKYALSEQLLTRYGIKKWVVPKAVRVKKIA